MTGVRPRAEGAPAASQLASAPASAPSDTSKCSGIVIAIFPSLARASAGKRWHAPELANDFRLLAECERGESLAQAFKLDEPQ
jgi:hypothetical protein